MVTIKISQKHVERFVFIVIILILSGLLVNEKVPGLLGEDTTFNQNIQNQVEIDQSVKVEIGQIIQEKIIQSIQNSNELQDEEKIIQLIQNEINLISQEKVDESEIIKNDVVSETTTTTTTTTSTTTTTTQALEEELIFSIEGVNYERIDENRGIIKDFILTIRNRQSNEADLEIEYYIYDQSSTQQEKLTPRRPQIVVGKLNPRSAFVEQSFRIDRYVFNLDYDKTIKIEIKDLNSGKEVEDTYVISSSRLKRID